MVDQPENHDALIWQFLIANDEANFYGLGFELPLNADGEINYQYLWEMPPSLLVKAIAELEAEVDRAEQQED